MDSKGVSPIVGIILAVAITVLLAVIAWTYLGGFTTTSPKTYFVGAKATENPEGLISITYVGGADHSQVDYLVISVSRVNGSVYTIKYGSEHDANLDTGHDAEFDGDGTRNENDSYYYYIIPLDNNYWNDGGNNTVLEVGYDGAPDSYTSFSVSPANGLGLDDDINDVKVGTVIMIQGDEGPNNNHITVSAEFLDGTAQTILDTWT